MEADSGIENKKQSLKKEVVFIVNSAEEQFAILVIHGDNKYRN